LEDNLELLRAQGVEEYVLEVITENDPAIGLYESFGFATVRRLRCLKLEDPARIDAEKPVDMVRLRECALSSAPWPILRPQRFYDPSWQNDMEARAASPRGGTTGTEDLVLVLAEECSSQELLGFVLCDADGGEILDFGLAHAEAGRGTEEEVLATLLLDLRRRQVSSGREEPLKILNVGADSQRALELLSNFGFESYVDQFEMRRAL
jgi:ribosomal protein S18 acetylase RimI-like enzyme